MNARVYTAASGEKSNHSFLIADLVLECYPKRKVTYRLSTSECKSLHSSEWRKEQPFILNHTSCVRMVSKYNMKVTYSLSASECMSSHSSKWRKEQPYILNRRSCARMLSKEESNLQA